MANSSANEWRSHHGEGELSGTERDGGGDPDDDRADHAGTAVERDEACREARGLCGVPGYVAHKQIDAVSAQELKAVRHISMGL